MHKERLNQLENIPELREGGIPRSSHPCEDPKIEPGAQMLLFVQ